MYIGKERSEREREREREREGERESRERIEGKKYMFKESRLI